MESMTAEQAEDLIDAVRTMDADPSSKEFQAINTKMGEVLNGLQEIIDRELDPEARHEAETVSPELSVVESPAASPEVVAAEERLAQIKEIFDMERGSFDKSTLRKAEKWQADLLGMQDLLGINKTGPLIGQIEKYKIDAENAQVARDVVSAQPSARRPAAASPGSRLPNSADSGKQGSRWGRLRAKIGL